MLYARVVGSRSANAIHDEIPDRARAAGWEAVYVGQGNQPREAERFGWSFSWGTGLQVTWFPAAPVSIKQVLDWIESVA